MALDGKSDHLICTEIFKYITKYYYENISHEKDVPISFYESFCDYLLYQIDTWPVLAVTVKYDIYFSDSEVGRKVAKRIAYNYRDTWIQIFLNRTMRNIFKI